MLCGKLLVNVYFHVLMAGMGHAEVTSKCFAACMSVHMLWNSSCASPV